MDLFKKNKQLFYPLQFDSKGLSVTEFSDGNNSLVEKDAADQGFFPLQNQEQPTPGKCFSQLKGDDQQMRGYL